KDLLPTNKENAGLWSIQGTAQYGLGQLEDALVSYQTAISLNPASAAARSNYALPLFALGRYVEALNASDAAILADQTFQPGYINAANALQAMGFPDQAVVPLQQAYELDKTNMQMGLVVAAMLLDTGDYDDARDIYFEIAAAKNPPKNIHAQINDFFKTAIERGAPKTKLVNDIDAWRQKHAHDPEVFEFVKNLKV
ncbi:MAG: tetratricopeptide repeat protein, partial [Lactobacillales bacterium]|nr:tetratricopeptide repeat protein [Lactobacillales bacterium]